MSEVRFQDHCFASLQGAIARNCTACEESADETVTTVALTIALSVLDSTEVAIPSAVYSIAMYPIVALFGYALTRRTAAGAARVADRPGERA